MAKFKSEKAPKVPKRKLKGINKLKSQAKSVASQGRDKLNKLSSKVKQSEEIKKIANKIRQNKAIQKLGTSWRQRLAINRVLGGSPKGLNLAQYGVKDLASRSAQVARQINAAQSMAGINKLSRLGLAKGASRLFLVKEGWDTARRVFNPKDNIIHDLRNVTRGPGERFSGTSPLAIKRNKRIDALEQREKSRTEAQVATTKAQVKEIVPDDSVIDVTSVDPSVPTKKTKPVSDVTVQSPAAKLAIKPIKKTFEDIWGRQPTSIQRKLLAGGWSPEELYAKKIAHDLWKKNRRR